MVLHEIRALVCITGGRTRETFKELSPVFERTFHIQENYEVPDEPDHFLYRVRSIFLYDCEQGKVEGVDLRQYEDYYVDATILEIKVISSEQLLEYRRQNPDIRICTN